MRIALLAPLVSPIAPPFLGGAQALLSDLAAELARRGHDVTLYAADGSDVPGVRMVPLGIDSARLRPASFASDAHLAADADDADNADDDRDPLDTDAATLLANYAFLHTFRAISDHAAEHDVLHAHAYDWGAYAYASLQPLPVVHTLHLPAVDRDIAAVLRALAPAGRPAPTMVSGGMPRLVTVSQACAATYAPYCRIDRVIYNGIHVEQIPCGARPAFQYFPDHTAPDTVEPYLLYAGRISPEKGVEDALEVAARTGRVLQLAGGIYDEAYFKQRIQPRLDALHGQAIYLGPLTRENLWPLMAGAEAVLCPVRWDEPFGLVACEALAAGAPVVGYARGGLREVVTDGETGWLVPPDDLNALAAAVARLPELDRLACRARAELHFSLDAMLAAYEDFYAQCLVGM